MFVEAKEHQSEIPHSLGSDRNCNKKHPWCQTSTVLSTNTAKHTLFQSFLPLPCTHNSRKRRLYTLICLCYSLRLLCGHKIDNSEGLVLKCSVAALAHEAKRLVVHQSFSFCPNEHQSQHTEGKPLHRAVRSNLMRCWSCVYTSGLKTKTNPAQVTVMWILIECFCLKKFSGLWVTLELCVSCAEVHDDEFKRSLVRSSNK